MVPQTTSRWMSISLNWNSSVVETNTLVSFTVHCLVHLGHTYHTYTDPLLRDEPTNRRYCPLLRRRRWLPDTSHTRSNARSHTPLLSTARYVAHGCTPACIRRRRRPPVSLHTRSYACLHTPSSWSDERSVPLYSCQRIFSTQESPSQQLWLAVRLADPPFAPHFVCIIHTWLNTSAS